ncbi:MAG TPA: N-acetylglucosamine-6-phosphate deacetylase [Cyanobacteria bacterium UBA11370]|nr:N-acetylglucosamine-6-phosphate deacetylase [Cyanobacteria bacterium UBA11370]HBY76285.1 N-acetylglucosamine-6-phosphate deacetylase [Cyanobacteria bacterium UBA11148]
MTIINARVPGYQGLQQIAVNAQGKIEAIAPMGEFIPKLTTLDITGDWISLGGVDLQINGALGLAFPDLIPGNEDRLHQICEFLWEQGVDGFLPTLVTTSVGKIQQSLSVIADFLSFQSNQEAIAQIWGVHLEGPFLHPDKRGAHPNEYLLSLTLENVKRVLGDYGDVVKVMTLAPELDETGEAIAYLRSLGITVSLGHSQATAAEAEEAFALGASMVTHGFNAMPALHHRQPGLLGAAITHPKVHCGLIADGQHVCPTMIQILLRASGYEDGVFLVSDALAPLGLSDGIYPWDSRQIEVKNGTARLEDGTLAGTTLPLLVGVENLVEWGICGVENAIALATESPRKAMGLPGIGVGLRGDLLRWHWDEGRGKLSWQRIL